MPSVPHSELHIYAQLAKDDTTHMHREEEVWKQQHWPKFMSILFSLPENPFSFGEAQRETKSKQKKKAVVPDT